jgi:hypothetical protein
MNLLKKLPWITILVAGILAIKFGPDIMGFLEEKAPSVAKAIKPTETA